MVNGTRPSQLITAVANVAGGAVAPRSPTLLQRQTTSMYSTASAETPVFVYGKAATPIAGAWSAEPWTPSGLAPTRLANVLSAEPEVTFEDACDDLNDINTNQDTASVADTVPFTEKLLSLSKSAYHATEVISPAKSEQTHVTFAYRHDPYALAQSRREVFRCECDDCADCTTFGRDDLAAYRSAYPSFGPGVAGPEMERYSSSDSRSNHHHDPYTADYYPAAYQHQHHDLPQPTAFVPPPPPPKITRGVMVESAEASLDVDAAFYHIAMRWYAKVSKVQHRFASEPCPVPDQEDQTFAEWVESVGRWWLRHFEHAQKKTSLSSGLLRTAVAPPRAAPHGFETHTSILASYAEHKMALKTGPRRELGTSGLTAHMLETHLAALPAPRSATKGLGGGRVEKLPW